MGEPTELGVESVEVRITALAAGGDGLGRLEDGRVVFVEAGVPGELVELEGLSLGKRMARARVGRVIEESPDRVEPECEHFGQCGGCSWQQIRYAAQLDAKRDIVRDALERIGGISIDHEIEIVASPDAYHYRARARVVETAGLVGYRRRHSRECIAVRDCPILVPAAQAKLHELAASSRARRETKKTSSRVSEWEISVGTSGEAELHRVGTRGGSGKHVQIDVLGESLRASPGSFMQGNALLFDALASEVRTQSLLGATKQEGAPLRLIELYAGIGFLTLPLARAGCTGTAFESANSAAKDLSANLARAGLAAQIKVVKGRVEGRGDWKQRFAQSDLLVVDPPRVGLESSLCESIANGGPERLVYVSCDPATLARDLKELIRGGYGVAHLRAFDLFPQTPHVEVVARLERNQGAE